MIEGVQPVCEEDGDKDRISSLPRNVIDRILELMLAQDAARTCVLSSKWRYIWANHPAMVVDDKFWYSIKQKRISKEFPVDFAIDTLNRMLLHHTGHIKKFVIDVSVVRFERHCDVDLWLSVLSRRGVKVLRIENLISTPYTLPSCVFSNSDLTKLSISSCDFKTTISSTALYKLKSLKLYNITLPSWVLLMPLLSRLSLKLCCGVHHFIISAPRLEDLTLIHNDNLNLVPYLACSDIDYTLVYVNIKFEHEEDCESINLIKLLSCWPKILNFSLDGLALEYLTTGIVPEEFSLMLSLRSFIPFLINFNMDQIAWVLRILHNSPLLEVFDIWSKSCITNDLEVLNYLEEQNSMNKRMKQLWVVKMKFFYFSRAEILFTKLLLRSAPSLERVFVEEDDNLDPIERLRIAKELMRLPRASPNAEIVFGPKFFPLEVEV